MNSQFHSKLKRRMQTNHRITTTMWSGIQVWEYRCESQEYRCESCNICFWLSSSVYIHSVSNITTVKPADSHFQAWIQFAVITEASQPRCDHEYRCESYSIYSWLSSDVYTHGVRKITTVKAADSHFQAWIHWQWFILYIHTIQYNISHWFIDNGYGWDYLFYYLKWKLSLEEFCTSNI